MKTVLVAVLMMTMSHDANADTALGYFNEKGEAVYLYKNGKAVKDARKPSSVNPDPSMLSRNLYFQEDAASDGSFTVRCYFPVPIGSNSITDLNCIKVK
ncbi:MAG TPA: hypothetical protein VIH99_10395 [Bdellovibrionota bacterium]|jgi:hypothetical protein